MSLPAFIAPRSHLLQKYSSCRTMFLCCDIQEKLRNRIPNFNEAVEVSNKMSAMCYLLTPTYATFVATEHFPESVGRFVTDIHLPKNTPVIAKYEPSMLGPQVLPLLEGQADKNILPVQQAVLWGHESHVCVLQTADALLQRNIRVAVVVDGCAAQKSLEHKTAIQTMASWDGLVLSTFVSVMMQLLRDDQAKAKEMLRLGKLMARSSAVKSNPRE